VFSCLLTEDGTYWIWLCYCPTQQVLRTSLWIPLQGLQQESLSAEILWQAVAATAAWLIRHLHGIFWDAGMFVVSSHLVLGYYTAPPGPLLCAVFYGGGLAELRSTNYRWQNSTLLNDRCRNSVAAFHLTLTTDGMLQLVTCDTVPVNWTLPGVSLSGNIISSQ